jgi:hypothetical protein
MDALYKMVIYSRQRPSAQGRSSLRATVNHLLGRRETIERPDIDPVFRSQLTLPEVHEDSSREPREFGDRPQSRQLRRRESRPRFDFDCETLATRITTMSSLCRAK